MTAANLLLERAWGKAKEQSPEEQAQAAIDLSGLTQAELGILSRLVQSGRLRELDPEPPDPPTEIEGTVTARG